MSPVCRNIVKDVDALSLSSAGRKTVPSTFVKASFTSVEKTIYRVALATEAIKSRYLIWTARCGKPGPFFAAKPGVATKR